MSKKDEKPDDGGLGQTPVKARVLVDSSYGKCNDVVEVRADDAGFDAGLLDSNDAAVAYALSLAEKTE